jgi:hypothetical protein
MSARAECDEGGGSRIEAALARSEGRSKRGGRAVVARIALELRLLLEVTKRELARRQAEIARRFDAERARVEMMT